MSYLCHVLLNDHRFWIKNVSMKLLTIAGNLYIYICNKKKIYFFHLICNDE